MALFEESGYQEADNDVWARTFYGPHYTVPPVDNVTIDGGPLNPQCPAGDPCPASINGYDSDVEVDLDIQRMLTVTPDAAKIIVYNVANDTDGQTELDAYNQIANDDSAAVISNSWVNGEGGVNATLVQAENVAFEQMAAQGQSFFNSAGDWGPVIDDLVDGSTAPSVADPAAQPWVTAAGGTTVEG